MDYYDATVAPTVGETITGVTSGKTATVSSASKSTAGTMVVASPSGTFTDGELLTGSTSGASFATLRCYIDRRYGFSYPDSTIVEYNGKKYCPEHFRAKVRNEALDEQSIDIREEE
jgi:hypothetical protein